MKKIARLAAALAGVTWASAAAAEVIFYDLPGFRGRMLTADRALVSFERTGFNDAVSSLVVRGGPWEFCEDPCFGGRCVWLRPGRYASLRGMGLDNQLSSARPVSRGTPPGSP